jgi:hypothetical protein
MAEMLRRVAVRFGLMQSRPPELYETTQPWVTYAYPFTDRWLALTRQSAIDATCCVCGERERIRIRVRDGTPKSGKHPKRVAFLARHEHPNERDNPYVWLLPLRNAAAWPREGLDVAHLVNSRMTTDGRRPAK